MTSSTQCCVVGPAEHPGGTGARGVEDPVDQRRAGTEHARRGLTPGGDLAAFSRLTEAGALLREQPPEPILGLGARGGPDALGLAAGCRDEAGDLLVVRAPERLEQVRQRHVSPRRGA